MKKGRKMDYKNPILKKLILSLAALILVLLLFFLIKNFTGKAIDASNIPTNPDQFKEASKNYLKQEYEKILINNTFWGPIIKVYQKVSPYISPVFKYTVGMPQSLSWLFALVLLVWITLFTYLNKIFSVFSTFSEGTSLVISFAFVVIMGGVLHLPEIIALWLIGLLSILSKWWVQLIAIIITIGVLSYIDITSGNVIKAIKKWNEKRKKDLELMRIKLKQEAQDEIQKSMVDTFEDGGGI